MADFVPAHITVVSYTTLTDKTNYDFNNASIEFLIDGGGSAILSGQKGYLMVPWNGTVTQVAAFADQPGAIKVDIWRISINDLATKYPPTIANSITNGNEITIPQGSSTDHFITSNTGWAQGNNMNQYDILAFNVDGDATNIQRVTISISMAKSVTATR